ncbi:MAG: hypothetical protein SO253_06240 [Bacilli bacterium]|nr:hypothetical protein [Bacilli bacterium]
MKKLAVLLISIIGLINFSFLEYESYNDDGITNKTIQAFNDNLIIKPSDLVPTYQIANSN